MSGKGHRALPIFHPVARYARNGFLVSDKLRDRVAISAYVCAAIVATLGWLALLWWLLSEFF